MIIDNVLYTPLDCPAQPEYSIDSIKAWANNNPEAIFREKERLADELRIAERIQPNYPWNVQVVYRKQSPKDTGWIAGFDAEFPELSKYFYEAFGLTLDDLGLVLLLPVKPDNLGIGFWHQDPDFYGLRMYLEYENQQDNTLLMRKVRDKDNVMQCKVMSNKQCFFLNNEFAEHTTYTTVPNKTRIAVLIIGKLDFDSQEAWKQKIAPLVEASAAKFTDYAITI